MKKFMNLISAGGFTAVQTKEKGGNPVVLPVLKTISGLCIFGMAVFFILNAEPIKIILIGVFILFIMLGRVLKDL